MTDEDFQYFLDGFGPQIERREAPPSSMGRYQNRLPDRLLGYWDEFGWAGYADGLFWIVNPQEYEGALSSWLSGSVFEGKDSFHVIAMGGFGELYVWGERFGFSFTIIPSESWIVPQHDFSTPQMDIDLHIRCFFLSEERSYMDTYDLFEEACARLGKLKSGEIYGFQPALALGGAVAVENLQKVSAVEHLTFLAQLEDLSILQMPD
jgi:hypothetical protein